MLNFTVHDKTESTPPQNHASEPENILGDIVNAILPFIKNLRDILHNPIKVIFITIDLICALGNEEHRVM